MAGKPIDMLLDSGASRNYLKPIRGLPGVTPVEKKFIINSIHGSTVISFKCQLYLFGKLTTFFILPQLKKFGAIIGMDFLLEVGAIVNFRNSTITTDEGVENINYCKFDDVNYSHANLVPESAKPNLELLIHNNRDVFADPEESLPFNTNIVATIRTTDNDPIYTKLYPYPVGVTEFVNKEISDLLEKGIIRKSRSPYNSPLWVVDKKGLDDSGNRKKRLVVDFRKLNDRTIDDKYPIPDISMILANMGKAKFFTTLDLRSSFHQIQLCEKDREKTAFSVNNGKYEFCRLPFGLKNAPSIFQRAIDDILREYIGIFVYVYIDDVIIYSINEDDHLKHIEWVLRVLFEANMRVSEEKSTFFQNSVEYLGFVVSQDGIRTCPEKVAAIRDFPQPENLFSVRSFLGLAGYYRRFIRDFAIIAKPLTDILKGENGTVSANKSKSVIISLNVEQLNSFHKLRKILSSEDVILLYPDFSKPFELTTDASSFGLGAVLSQNGKPITMISRSLKDCEANYATNERELLAIVWSLKRLRNYLYGVKNLKIFSDHQPLSFSVSDKNTNAKIKRWMAFIEEHNAKIVYKPGKDNLVADALSRHVIYALDHESTAATIHSEASLTNIIRRTETPINCYNNQIIIEESDDVSVRTFILFKNKKRHVIRFNDINSVIDNVKTLVNPSTVNAIHCELTVLAAIQHRLVEIFPVAKFWHAPKFVQDITNNDEQKEIITTEHVRAHRGAQNVVETVLLDYYFPRMGKIAQEIVSNCRICQEAKYVRHPVKQLIGKTPIPSRPGERIHIDIFSINGKYFLTAIDKFSKFALVQHIASRSIVDITPHILQIINQFPDIKHIYCDNEASFNSRSITELLQRFDIQLSNSPPDHSTSNGQVERFHSTLSEIARCLKEERHIEDTVELILLASIEYNKTIHSVIENKPVDVLFRSTAIPLEHTKSRLMKSQDRQLEFHNKNRKGRQFEVGDKVFIKKNKRLGNKLTSRFVSGRIEADLGSTVLIRGRIVHKDNIR